MAVFRTIRRSWIDRYMWQAEFNKVMRQFRRNPRNSWMNKYRYLSVSFVNGKRVSRFS